MTLVVGKFSASDLFDNNVYSHDPRTQFLNWSLMDAGSWDYPADTRGYTYGVSLEYAQEAFRGAGAAAMVPLEANGTEMDLHLWKAHGFVVEGQTSSLPTVARGRRG